MIEAKNISFSYKKPVLSSVDLTIRDGELCAVIGRNGSGKTTLLRLLAGSLKPDHGELYLNRKSFLDFSSRDFSKSVGYFPQSRSVPEMSVYDYVSYGRYPYAGIAFNLSRDDKRKIENALMETGISDFADKMLTELSGGERRLVYLAQLLAQGADHILLDEPTAFSDVQNAFLVTDILRKQSEAKKAVIAVMHDLPLALSSFDRILVLDGGKLIADGSPDAVSESGAIEQAFGVSCKKTPHGYVICQS